MKYAHRSIQAIVAACVLSLSFSKPVMAQQEVSPDHYDSVSVQDHQISKVSPKAGAPKPIKKADKKRTSKAQRAHIQTASLKKMSS